MTSSNDSVRNVLIIGSGPAGLTAAIYTARANLAPLVIEGEPSSTTDQPGGQLMLTTEVENFPGFVDGIMGPELMANFRAQAARFGTEFVTARVSKLDTSERPFKVWVGDPNAPEPTYRAHSVIVSTGAQSLMLGLPAEDRLLGHGLSTCATCDGFFFRSHEIAVVGGGDSALEEALFLTKFADKVTIILNKPVGYVSHQSDKGYRLAASLIQARTQHRTGHGPAFDPAHLRGLAPAGRLDIDSQINDFHTGPS